MLKRLIFLIIFLPNFNLSAQSINKDQDFVRLADLSTQFVFDMRYATDNNFIGKRVYDCADCLVRIKVAKALISANESFMKKGYRIKFFDCYRPLDVQKVMWKVYPNPSYVADPKKGSIHNRGGAVDITLVDEHGQELLMGTSFDHFGKEAHHAYQNLPQEVLDNRKLLKEGMKLAGFNPITTEWWHYNFGEAIRYAISNFKTECGEE